MIKNLQLRGRASTIHRMARYLIGIIMFGFIIGGFYYGMNISPSPDTSMGAPAPERIVLGFVGPLSGDAVSYGQSIKNAVFLAVRDLKTQGTQVNVVYEDGMCDDARAVRALTKLHVIDEVLMVVGGVCNGETLAMAPLAEKEHIILFSPTASSPAITTAGDFVFRNNPSDAYIGNILGRALAADYSGIAVLSSNSDGAQALRRAFVERYTNDGGAIIIDESFSADTNATLLKGLVKRVVESDAAAIVVNAQTEQEAIVIIKELHKAKSSIPIYGSSLLGSEKFIEGVGPAGDTIFFIDVPLLNDDNPGVQAFLDDYTKFFGLPGDEFSVAATYDAVNLLIQAVKIVGYTADRIRDYLYNLPQYDGLIGSYSFDANGDVVGIPLVIKQINKGVVEVYTDL